MRSQTSPRQILKSTSIIGGAAVANVAIGLGKMKLAALLLGPAGVGLISLYQSLVATAAQLGGLGIANASVRQVARADADGDAAALAAARRALFAGTAVLAMLAALLVWLLSAPIARHVIDGVGRPGDLVWIALAIGLTIVAGSQQYLLNGFRRIGDLARLSIASALVGAVLGIAALLAWGDGGIAAYVLAIPVGAVVCGAWYARRLKRVAAEPSPRATLTAEAKLMLGLGITMMLGGLAAPLSQLVVRSLVGARLGAVPLGEYSAASMIALTYVGFILTAMGADYYPRLAAAINDKREAVRLVNQQAEVALLLGAPLFLAMQTAAPWVIQLLFSREFAGAADVLRVLVLADTLKLLGWPLGFVVLAAGRGRLFLLNEALFGAIFVAATFVALPRWGIVATGIGALAMYLVYLPLMVWLARRSIGFRWERQLWWTGLAVIGAVAAVGLASLVSDRAALAVGAPLTIGVGLFAVHRLGHLAEVGSPAGRWAQALAARLGWRR